jgi:hypothetical protein
VYGRRPASGLGSGESARREGRARALEGELRAHDISRARLLPRLPHTLGVVRNDELAVANVDDA